MPVDSLLDMSLRACARVSKRITDIGALPYSLARPFLLKIDSPEQLHAIEENCEQIIGHDAEIWLALIKRDIPSWDTKRHTPKNPKNWWKVYRKLKQDALMEMGAGVDKLAAALDNQNEKQWVEVKSRKLLPQLPKEEPPAPKPAERILMKSLDMSSFPKVGGKASKKPNMASTRHGKMSVLAKIKKEVQQNKAARAAAEQQIRKRMTTTVTRAPAKFVEDVQTQRQRSHQSSEKPICIPAGPMAIRKPEASPKSLPRTNLSAPLRSAAIAPLPRPAVTHQQLKEREARLRALKIGVPTSVKHSPPTETSSSPPTATPTRNDVPMIPLKLSPRPIAATRTLSASCLEEKSTANANTMKNAGFVHARSDSAGTSRSASPHLAPLVRKRKPEPDIFMPTPKRRSAAEEANTPLR